MKHFALCLNDKYVPYACVTIQSILMHHKKNEIFFHLVTDGFCPSNCQKLDKVCGGANLEICTISDDTELMGLNMAWSKYGWYRLFLPQLLPSVEKILYLDCDVCVTDSLDDLFALDMTEKSVAGALDPESFGNSVYERLDIPKAGYVCSGVLMMNLDYWREHDLTTKVFLYGKTYPEKTLFPDQDAINVICGDTKQVFSPRYSPFLRIAKYYADKEWQEYINHPAIIHYAGCAPWKGNPNKHPFHHYWWKAFRQMPLSFWNVRMEYATRQLKYLIKRLIRKK